MSNQAFVWQLPNIPPDPDALARLKVHFPKPSQPMPYAWFMGKIDYFTELMEVGELTKYTRLVNDEIFEFNVRHDDLF